MNSHALTVLEFDKILSMLGERTSFEPAAELASRLEPCSSRESIVVALDRTSELRSMLDSGELVPLHGLGDIRGPLGLASREGAALSCEDLVAVKSTAACVRRVRAFISSRRESCPNLWVLAGALSPHEEIEEAIENAIDESSLEIVDRASKELSRVRRSIETTRTRLNEKLQDILRREVSRGTIQDPVVHLRQGRLVLPVKRSARSRLPGLVHDESGSGGTLFVEPMATIELNNELAALVADEKKEVLRILRSLTALVGAARDDLLNSLGVLAELDYHRASALLSRDLGCSRPKLLDRHVLHIRGGRHPVLLDMVARGGGDVTPLDLELGEEATTLVISGPNTGGKTVALKTVGLLVVMAQSGLHIPAAPDTELGLFDDVFADIGDEQSIEQSLSTFSSHMQQIVRILNAADAGSLVLVDELGAGTDPDEGASLAICVLEELTRRAILTIATTHHGSVKNFVHERSGMVNGSMAFDPGTLEPTFRFSPGIPGSSHALAIAESLGLPDHLVERARGLRSRDAVKVDDLLVELAEGERRLRESLTDAERERERARLLARDYEARLAGVRDERKRMKTAALAEVREILERGRSVVEETVKEVRAEEAARETIRKAREKLKRERAKTQKEIETLVRPPRMPGLRRPGELTPGMVVWVASLGRSGKLLDMPDDRGRARVRIRRATAEVDEDDLREVPETAAEPEDTRPRVSYDVASGEPADELDLRGMATDEIGDAIERQVGSALIQGLRTIRIVHGKGTGALRSKTHEILERHPSVRTFRLGRWGEGDTGVTIVELE